MWRRSLVLTPHFNVQEHLHPPFFRISYAAFSQSDALIPWRGCWLTDLESWKHRTPVTPCSDKNFPAGHWLSLFIILIMDESSKAAEVDRMKGYLAIAAAQRIWSYPKSTTSDSPLSKSVWFRGVSRERECAPHLWPSDPLRSTQYGHFWIHNNSIM